MPNTISLRFSSKRRGWTIKDDKGLFVTEYLRPWDGYRPLPPGGILATMMFLILRCLSYKMRHVSPLRSVALSCNIKITYVTPKMLKNRLMSML